MEKTYFSVEQDGFYGVYYPCRQKSSAAFIVMFGDSSDDFMAKCGVKWLLRQNCNVLAMSADKKSYSFCEFPMERFETAIELLKTKGNDRIGFMGVSTTGMIALAAASIFPDITLTVALTACDFVMEGYHQEKGREFPGNYQSTLTWQGKPLPFLPYVWRGNDYWDNVMAYSKETGNKIASITLFEESEKAHPVTENERIKVENIKGTLVLVGAEDDCLWNTCKYIRRMQKVLEEKETGPVCHALTYERGTHFVFPQGTVKGLGALMSLMVYLAFSGARGHIKECKKTREDIDRKVTEIITHWRTE